MGVTHLNSWASKHQSSKAPSGRTDAVQIKGLNNPAYTKNTTKVPNESGVQRFANRSGVTNTGVSAPAHPANGGRLGEKTGQSKIGGKAPGKGMSGGRLG